MISSQRIAVADESQVGRARRVVIDLCRRQGASETQIGKVGIVATELANNLVRHGKGGELIVREIPDQRSAGIELLALDHGPGFRNVAECMRDGYSTIGTAGTGLGSIQRICQDFQIFSPPTGGAVILAVIQSGEPTSPQTFQSSGINVPLASEEVSGDAWEIVQQPNKVRVMVADGLGHGPFAEEAAREAIAVFRQNISLSPAQTLQYSHEALTKTRGASAAVVEITPGRSEVVTAGVGNIAMRVVDAHAGTSKSFICDNGTLGANLRKVHQFSHAWSPNSILVMHSDGLGSSWDLTKYPGLSERHAGLIAGVLYRDFRKERDDVTVVVTRRAPHA